MEVMNENTTMEAKQQSSHQNGVGLVDWLVRFMNAYLFLFQGRKGSNFRWANYTRDAVLFTRQFAAGQFTKVYGRLTSKYKYHPQQQYENAIRKFDLKEHLAAELHANGTANFYSRVCGQTDFTEKGNEADLTKIDDLRTVKASAEYVFNDVLEKKSIEAAETARTYYARGFSRIIDVFDRDDWERFRSELRNQDHSATSADTVDQGVSLIALSYKGDSAKTTTKIRDLDQNGIPEDQRKWQVRQHVQGEGAGMPQSFTELLSSALPKSDFTELLSNALRKSDERKARWQQTEIRMTSDFLDDFRWSQLIRSCQSIATFEDTSKVRVWIDRLLFMNVSPMEIAKVFDEVDWEEFGLFPYAVCPVVRVYDAQEPNYGTNFWRKLETVLGVAGRGLVVDDYMLRKYDKSIFYGESIYRRLNDGLARLGGTGIYVRSTTLALATALLTEAVSVSLVNEDMRSKAAESAYKAWALRTIAEGAYSKRHRSMMCKEVPFKLQLRDFKLLVFWESITSKSKDLVGKNFLDLSLQRSIDWGKSPGWDGVVEWAGMMVDSVEIEDRELMTQYIARLVTMKLFTSTSGHVAAKLTMLSDDQDQVHKRTIVVELSRFSTAKEGHVTSVAEATGLWDGSVLPWYLKFVPNPDEDQEAVVGGSGITYRYKQMKVSYRFIKLIALIFLSICFVILIALSNRIVPIPPIVVALVVIGSIPPAIMLILPYLPIEIKLQWPWCDRCDVGEAVFDNVRLDALFDSGIKKQYRRLEANVAYEQLGWY